MASLTPLLRGAQQDCSFSGRLAPHVAKPLRHGQGVTCRPRLERKVSARRSRKVTQCGSSPSDKDKDIDKDDGLLSAGAALGWIEEFITTLEDQTQDYEGVLEATQANLNSAGSGLERALWAWQLGILRNFEANDQETIVRAKKIADKVRELPRDMDLVTATTKLSNDKELRASFLGVVEGVVVVADSLTRGILALLFAWCTIVLLGAQPYQLWHVPEKAPLTSFAEWTVPYLALGIGLVATGKLSERNPQRLVADPEDSALGWGVVTSSGWKGTATYSVCTALAAGVVYRGVWLNSLLAAALDRSRPAGGALLSLDPAIAEQNLRDSFGTLVPSVPLPAVLVTAGVVLGVGALETCTRSVSRGASLEVWVQESNPDGTETETPLTMVPNQIDLAESMDDDPPAAGRFAIADEWYEALPPNDIAIEFVMNTWLVAETIATGSLWASIATHALTTAACVYACKAGLGGGSSSQPPGERQQKGEEPAAAGKQRVEQQQQQGR